MVYEIREWLRLIENSQEDEKSKYMRKRPETKCSLLDLGKGKDGNPVSGRCFLG